jgi:hypothetical protein
MAQRCKRVHKIWVVYIAVINFDVLASQGLHHLFLEQIKQYFIWTKTIIELFFQKKTILHYNKYQGNEENTI